MIHLGKTARYVRERKKLTLREAAAQLHISFAHLCNIENNKVAASLNLLEQMKLVYGVDLMVLAWCIHGDPEKLPPAVREPMKALAAAWKSELGDMVTEEEGE